MSGSYLDTDECAASFSSFRPKPLMDVPDPIGEYKIPQGAPTAVAAMEIQVSFAAMAGPNGEQVAQHADEVRA